MFWAKTLLAFTIILACALPRQNALSAQQKDTLAVYKKIKKVAAKHKFTKIIYDAVFVDPAPAHYDKKPLSTKQRQQNKKNYDGKIIRHIKIKVLGPFGYSVNDTTKRDINRLQEFGNRLHVNTREWVINNQLLFREKDTVDMLAISESERILRSMGTGYVNDARIFFNPVPHSDSVDVEVVVHDKWSRQAAGALGTTWANGTLRDKNLFGWGQTFEQFLSYDLSKGYESKSTYHINNLDHSYISSDLFYYANRDINQAGINFNRPFYSPLAKWAGGVALNHTWTNFKYLDSTGEELQQPLQFYYYDVWGAKSYSPRISGKQNRTHNIVLGLRTARTIYNNRPSFTIDTGYINSNTTLYLGSLGYSIRHYYKDQFIFRFGANEDIPEGFLAQWQYGYLDNETRGPRYYTGFELSRGRLFDGFGYLSGYVNYGTYFNKNITPTATWNAGFTYFSVLNEWKRWYMRQFIYYKLSYGINKQPLETTGFDGSEMYGFNTGNISGTRKMVLNFETVLYAPYNIIGFRFAPIGLAGVGLLTHDGESWGKSLLYQSYAVGLLIRNENLLTNSFQVSVGLYSNLPGDNNVMRFNPVTTFTLKIRSFDISRPEAVGYQ